MRIAQWHAGHALTLPEGKERAFHGAAAVRLVDAVVVNPVPVLPPAIADLRRTHPSLPIIAYAPFRPDDGPVLVAAAVAGKLGDEHRAVLAAVRDGRAAEAVELLRRHRERAVASLERALGSAVQR